jgi:hypothetical protein
VSAWMPSFRLMEEVVVAQVVHSPAVSCGATL